MLWSALSYQTIYMYKLKAWCTKSEQQKQEHNVSYHTATALSARSLTACVCIPGIKMNQLVL